MGAAEFLKIIVLADCTQQRGYFHEVRPGADD
jgi:hypothetical protein